MKGEPTALGDVMCANGLPCTLGELTLSSSGVALEPRLEIKNQSTYTSYMLGESLQH